MRTLYFSSVQVGFNNLPILAFACQLSKAFFGNLQTQEFRFQLLVGLYSVFDPVVLFGMIISNILLYFGSMHTSTPMRTRKSPISFV